MPSDGEQNVLFELAGSQVAWLSQILRGVQQGDDIVKSGFDD